jgi:hypothetical protein
MSTSLDQVPNRVLSPEEFQQAQTMAPAAVTADAFPDAAGAARASRSSVRRPCRSRRRMP